MADNRIFQVLKINGNGYRVKPCWESLSITKEYMLALLDRDEYTPVLASKPTATQTIYVDPASGNPAGFHPGQCACYPDNGSGGGFGLSIVKNMSYTAEGIPETMGMFDATDLEKRVEVLERIVDNGCFGNGRWYNTLKWQNDAVWDNGNEAKQSI